jgi:hypothetical protein
MLVAGTWFSFVNPMGLPTINQPVVGRVCVRPATGIFAIPQKSLKRVARWEHFPAAHQIRELSIGLFG